MKNIERRGAQKEMEYEEAPSGYVMLYNYKEPFMPYEGGFGYQGVLMFDGASDTVQCHLCGGWFGYLPKHIAKEHTTTAAQYKEMVGLLPSTALISEGQRAVLIASGQERFKNLRPNLGHSEATKEKIRQSQLARKDIAEKRNIYGTCPAQLIDRLQKKYTELGYTPDRDEIIGYNTFVRLFGSWKEACNRAGVPHRTSRQRKPNKKYTDEEKVVWIRAFYAEHGRLPKISTRGETKVIGRVRPKMFKILCNAALTQTELPPKRMHMYTTEALIESLQEFRKNEDRNPSHSDCIRGLLPGYHLYKTRFGSWKNAIKEAGLAYS